MSRGAILALITAVVIVASCGFGIFMHRPPAALGAEAPAAEFSALRAMDEVRRIAARPHPIGSPANLGVRDYLLRRLAALGVEPEVQEATVVHGWRVVDVENVVARLPGSSSNRAILLVAHYDSVPMSPGAGDAGAAVAVMLETLRALSAGGPLRNDVIFLFTNPEEVYLHGGKAFIDQHPWIDDVGLVINMDPGGVSGPAYLHGTSDQNGWLIEEFGGAAPYPMGSSLAAAIKRNFLQDRNDEFGLFADAGLPGYNISFVGGDIFYHTRLDSPDNVDPRSLQQLGGNALGLVRHFGHRVLEDRRESDAVYFNPVGSWLVSYPESYVFPMTVGLVILFLVVVALGMIARRFTLGGMALGLAAYLVAAVLAPLAVMALWWLMKTKFGVFDAFLTGGIYQGELYLIAFVSLALAVASAVYSLVFRWTNMENLAFGGFCVWVALSVAAAAVLPGGSYLFLWPLFFSLVAMAYAFPRLPGEEGNWLGALVFLVGSIPGMVLVSAHVYPVFGALSMDEAPYLTLLPVLLLGLLIPLVWLLMEASRWALPVVMITVTTAALAMIFSGSTFDATRPQPNFVVYGLDADEGEAVWATRSRAVELKELDTWTEQFFPDGMRPGMLKFFPWSQSIFLQGKAFVAPLEPPIAELLQETSGADGRTLRFRIRSPRGAPILIAVTDRKVASLSVAGRMIDHPQLLAYWAFPDEGFELTVETGDDEPLTLTLIDESYGLPDPGDGSILPRPADMMEEPSGGLIFSDATLVRRSYSF